MANIHREPVVNSAQTDLLRASAVKYEIKAMSVCFQAAHSAEMSKTCTCRVPYECKYKKRTTECDFMMLAREVLLCKVVRKDFLQKQNGLWFVVFSWCRLDFFGHILVTSLTVSQWNIVKPRDVISFDRWLVWQLPFWSDLPLYLVFPARSHQWRTFVVKNSLTGSSKTEAKGKRRYYRERDISPLNQ